MRALPYVLVALFLMIQHPLWIGKGGWLRVWELDRQLNTQVQGNDLLANRNNALAAEVQDLQQGHHAIEERARYELGMIGPDEIFVQINELPVPQRANSPATSTALK